jgi:D-alanyl-D-alanine carboxypeptidase
MTTPRRLANGRFTSYGCGLTVGERDGMVAWGHLGATAGFTARSGMLPASRSAVVLMTHVDNATGPLGDLYLAIIRLLMPDHSQPPVVSGLPALAVGASLFGQLQAGTVDRSRLSEEFNAFLTAERAHSAQKALSRLGKPKSIEVTAVEERGGMAHVTLLFKFDSSNLEAEMYRSADGLVQQFLVLGK